MFEIKYRNKFDGLGIGRVARDENFTEKLPYFYNEYELQYIFEGTRLFFANGRCYKLSSGCVAIIDKNMIPKTCIIGGEYHDRLLIEMTGAAVSSLTESLNFDFNEFFKENYGVLDLRDSAPFEQAVLRLEQEVMNGGRNQEFRVKLGVLELLDLLDRNRDRRVPVYESDNVKSSISKQLRIHEIADYIAEHYWEIDSVEELSQTFYMSKSYLCRMFKEVINFTVSEYINYYRIAASKGYLLDSDYSITEIANLLGYDSLTYFERVFKKSMSVTPLRYRKLHQSYRETQLKEKNNKEN